MTASGFSECSRVESPALAKGPKFAGVVADAKADASPQVRYLPRQCTPTAASSTSASQGPLTTSAALNRTPRMT